MIGARSLIIGALGMPIFLILGKYLCGRGILSNFVDIMPWQAQMSACCLWHYIHKMHHRFRRQYATNQYTGNQDDP